jgi:hypothetical protein
MNKKTVAAIGLTTVGVVLAYLGFKSLKKLDKIDFVGENLYDEYYYTQKNR